MSSATHNQRVITVDKDLETISKALIFLMMQPGVEIDYDLLWDVYVLRGANEQSRAALREEVEMMYHANRCV